MYLPYDPLREAILLELNRAICIRRAQGASLEALGTEYGLSMDALQRIADADDRTPERNAAKTIARSRARQRLI